MYKVASFSIAILLVIMISYDAYAQTPTSIKLLTKFGYLDSDQNYVVVGEVVNQGGPVKFVQVNVQFFDAQLKPLTSMSGSVGIETLNPGQMTPFKVVLSDQTLTPLVKSFTVNVVNFVNAEEKPRKLDVLFHEVERSGDNVTLRGRVANDGNELSQNTKVIVVLYNVVGEPVRYMATFTDPKNVLPASSGTFSFKINAEKTGTIAGYAIYSESSQYAETTHVVNMQAGALQKLEETVNLMDLSILNQGNQPTRSVNVGEPALFTITAGNNALVRQQYMYILQIKDQNGFVVSISWIINLVDVRQNTKSTIAWVPLERGSYTAEAFMWKSLDEAIPLSFRTLSKTLTVV